MAEEKKKRGRPRKKPSALLPIQEIVEKVIKEEKEKEEEEIHIEV
jgi:predicted transcriptional regulator